MELAKLDLKNFFFVAILVLLGWVMLQLFSPFLNVIIIALVIVQLFHPIYTAIFKRVKNSSLASLITTVITIITVVLPMIFIALLIITEIANVLPAAAPAFTSAALIDGTTGEIDTTKIPLSPSLQAIQNTVNGGIESLNGTFQNLGLDTEINQPDISSLLAQVLESIKNSVLPLVNGVISFSISAVFNAFILIVTLLYMFPAYERLPFIVSRISPLDDQLDQLLVKKFTETNRAVIIGSFFVAIAQASAVSIALLLLGVGSPVLLWVIMVILSLIPVGSGLVWGPIGIGLILSGQPIVGLALIFYGAVIINVIDTTLRPYLMRETTQLHPLVIIFSALGGISLFGPLGILYGPLIAVFFTSLMDIYTLRFSGTKLHHVIIKEDN